MTTVPSFKPCAHCAKPFNRPLRKGRPLCKPEWLRMRYCSRLCAARGRGSYLSTHAEETRTLRGGCGETGPHQVECIRDMHSCDEAQATPQTKKLGSLSLCVKAPALQAERDVLFDKYLRAYDNYKSWKAKEVHVYTTNRNDHSPLNMETILKRHLDEISEQLRTYDDRINASKTTGPLQYC